MGEGLRAWTVGKAMIYAVIWTDFGIPLSLPCASESAAVEKAKAMHGKAPAIRPRAVSLSPNDKLTTLWQSEVQ